MTATSPHRLGMRSTLLLILLGVVACEDSPSQPRDRGMITTDRVSVEFAETDVVLGSIEAPVVRISNSGAGPLTVNGVSIDGTGPSPFSVTDDGGAPFTLSPGEEREVTLGFDPTDEGAFFASLRIAGSDGTTPAVSVSLTGTASRFVFDQVDRMGIPALNTVFNHPSGIAFFDKTAYNVASPADDVATYRDQFIIVLDAVGNPDSGATADLLLPDELPINMGAATAFGMLTGRAPTDDATDVALSVTVGIPELQSDNVPENDKPFLETFPFFAAPH